MKKTWLIAGVLLIGLLGSLGWMLLRPALLQTVNLPPFQARTLSGPTPQPTIAVPGNLLRDPSFEGNFVNCGHSCNVAPEWTAWSAPGNPPPCIAGQPGCYIPCPLNCTGCDPMQVDVGCWWAKAEHKAATLQFPERVHTGAQAQQAFVYGRMGEFGVYQVNTVTPGSLLRFSVYAQAWQCADPKSTTCKNGQSDVPDKMNLRVGIGTQGETDPYASSIVWSAPIESFDHYSPISVTAMAQNSTVTVFVYARPEWGWARINNDAYWDDAALVVIGPPAGFSFDPPQPELGQPTTVQVTSYYAHPDTTLLITTPQSAPLTPVGGARSGDEPYTWTWYFTPTLPGTYTLAFSSGALTTPISATLRAIATAHLTAQPTTVWLDQPARVQVTSYYRYSPYRLTIATPGGDEITPAYEGLVSGGGVYTRTWRLTSTVTGTHLLTFTANLIETPVTGRVHVVSVAGGSATPPAPPVGSLVTIQMGAYYPYTDISLTLTDPQGTPLTPNPLGQIGSAPFVWAWTFTPVITGAHRYTITATRLDVPVRGLVLAGGQTVHLPLVMKASR